MRSSNFFLLIAIATLASYLGTTENANCQFSIAGYYLDPTVPNQYDIIGANLSEITKMTISPYAPQGDVNASVSFNLVSNQELTFTLDGSLTNDVDLTFSDPNYSVVGVTLVNTGGRFNFPLITVGDGQTLAGGEGSQRVLVEAGGSYGNGGGGSNVEFIQNGGTFTGNSGGGSNTTYFEPYAYGTNDSGGGGSENYVEVNEITVLSAIDPSSILSGNSTSTAPVAISGSSATVTSSSSTGYGLLSLSATGTTTLFNYVGGTGVLSAAEIFVAQGGTAIIRNSGTGVLTLPPINENGGILVLKDGKFIIQSVSGSDNSDPIIDGSTVGYTTSTTYSGPTSIIHGGALLVGVSNALPTSTYTDLTLGATDDGGAGQTNTLDLLGTSQTVDSLTNIGPDNNQVISSNGYASGNGSFGPGPVSGTGPSTTTGNLTVDTTNYTGGVDTFSGSLGGTSTAINFGLTKTGTGTLALTGNNTYAGGTVINGGALLAKSSNSTGSGAVTVNSGGTLGGSGTIATSSVLSGNAVTIASGGILNQSIVSSDLGTSTLTLALHAGSTVNLANGAVFAFDLGASGINDQVDITGGTLTLNGQNFSNFTFTTLAGFTGTGTYDLFATGGTGDIIGSLGTTMGTIDGYNATLSVFNSQDLELTISGVPEPSTWVLLVVGLGLLAFWRLHRSPA